MTGESPKRVPGAVVVLGSLWLVAFVAEVPELPGCAAHGETPDVALANCQEAIGLWIDTAEEFGRAVPEPKGRRLQFA